MTAPTSSARRRRTVRYVAALGVALVTAGTFAFVNSTDASAANATLTPTAMTTVSGATGSGEPVSNLAVQDETGTAGDWNKYVEFSGQYSGYLSYTEPGTVTASSISGIQALVNYRGPAAATQTWTFSLYDWVTGSWTAIGTNASAPDWGNWTLLTFNAPGTLSDYVSAGSAIRLQLKAGNNADAADIDYAALVLTTGTQPSASASASATPTASPSTSPSASPSPSPSASPSPSPSASPSASPSGSGGLPGPTPCAGCWHPALQTSWNWVLAKVPTAPYRSVQMYDVDGFDAAASDVTAMHNAGMKVVCYISAGTYENWRPDASSFPAAIIGSGVSGWAGENWLDVRDVQKANSALASIMGKRLDMCHTKGFDAVEFDNVDGYANPSGFPLTSGDQAYYNVFLANAAHQRGMSAVLKNDLGQVTQLLPYFDMALNEQCNQYSECGVLSRFVAANKPVFNAEYASSTGFCTADNTADFNGVNYSQNLDDSKFQPCR